MTFEQKIENYIDLVLTLGINIKKGDKININIATSADWFAQKLVKRAYERGASLVLVDFKNDIIARHNYDFMSDEQLQTVYPHQVERDKLIADEGFKLISVSVPDPFAMNGVDSKKVQLQLSSYLEQCYRTKKNASSNLNTWTVIALANQKWADYATDGDLDKLWEMIFKATRTNEENYLELWKQHITRLLDVGSKLDEYQFEKLHFTNELGTDLVVGLVDNHIWAGAEEENTRRNEMFVANLPTEEVFTMPHKTKTNGVVIASKPLNYNGQIIEDFKIKFEGGKAVEYSAKKGQEALESIITTDQGSAYLGEVALVSKHSPINQMNQLFFNTLFDENSSCHLAFGNAYPITIKNSASMDKQQKEASGMNESKAHVDFMFGTDDLKIVGIKGDQNVVIFDEGDFVI